MAAYPQKQMGVRDEWRTTHSVIREGREGLRRKTLLSIYFASLRALRKVLEERRYSRV
jgi:hypothetical protein